MDHKHKRSHRLEGKAERRLSPLNPLSAVINNPNITTSSQKNEESTYIQSQLRQSTISDSEENINIVNNVGNTTNSTSVNDNTSSNDNTTTTTSGSNLNNNNNNNNTNINNGGHNSSNVTSPNTPTPTTSSSINSNIRNDESFVKRKSVTGISPTLRRLSRCLSDASELSYINNDDQNFSVSSSALTQTSSSVRPIPIPNPLPLRRISRCSVSSENDENVTTTSYANNISSVKTNIPSSIYNNPDHSVNPMNNSIGLPVVNNNNYSNANFANVNNPNCNISSSLSTTLSSIAITGKNNNQFPSNSISSSITSNNSFISNNSILSSTATVGGGYGRKYIPNNPIRRRSRGLSFNNSTNIPHNFINNSINFSSSFRSFKNVTYQNPQNDEIFTIDDDESSNNPKPQYPARLYALSSSSPCVYPIFKNNQYSNLSTPVQHNPPNTITSSHHNSTTNSRKTSVEITSSRDKTMNKDGVTSIPQVERIRENSMKYDKGVFVKNIEKLRTPRNRTFSANFDGNNQNVKKRDSLHYNSKSENTYQYLINLSREAKNFKWRPPNESNVIWSDIREEYKEEFENVFSVNTFTPPSTPLQGFLSIRPQSPSLFMFDDESIDGDMYRSGLYNNESSLSVVSDKNSVTSKKNGPLFISTNKFTHNRNKSHSFRNAISPESVSSLRSPSIISFGQTNSKVVNNQNCDTVKADIIDSVDAPALGNQEVNNSNQSTNTTGYNRSLSDGDLSAYLKGFSNLKYSLMIAKNACNKELKKIIKILYAYIEEEILLQRRQMADSIDGGVTSETSLSQEFNNIRMTTPISNTNSNSIQLFSTKYQSDNEDNISTYSLSSSLAQKQNISEESVKKNDDTQIQNSADHIVSTSSLSSNKNPPELYNNRKPSVAMSIASQTSTSYKVPPYNNLRNNSMDSSSLRRKDSVNSEIDYGSRARSRTSQKSINEDSIESLLNSYKDTSPLVEALVNAIFIAQTIIDMDVGDLITTGMCRSIIEEIQSLQILWNKNPSWPGKTYLVRMLMNFASVARLVEHLEADARIWNYSNPSKAIKDRSNKNSISSSSGTPMATYMKQHHLNSGGSRRDSFSSFASFFAVAAASAFSSSHFALAAAAAKSTSSCASSSAVTFFCISAPRVVARGATSAA